MRLELEIIRAVVPPRSFEVRLFQNQSIILIIGGILRRKSSELKFEVLGGLTPWPVIFWTETFYAHITHTSVYARTYGSLTNFMPTFAFKISLLISISISIAIIQHSVATGLCYCHSGFFVSFFPAFIQLARIVFRFHCVSLRLALLIVICIVVAKHTTILSALVGNFTLLLFTLLLLYWLLPLCWLLKTLCRAYCLYRRS